MALPHAGNAESPARRLFMRLFAHHRFRELVKRHLEDIGTAAPESWRPKHLFIDPKDWVPSHFRAGSRTRSRGATTRAATRLTGLVG